MWRILLWGLTVWWTVELFIDIRRRHRVGGRMLAFLPLIIYSSLLVIFPSPWKTPALLATGIGGMVCIPMIHPKRKWGLFAALIPVLLVTFASHRFELQGLASRGALLEQDLPTLYSVAPETLPLPVQKWLNRSGVLQHVPVGQVHIQQRGEMRIQPEGPWLSFSASQWVDVIKPAFVWEARVRMLPGVYLAARDRLLNGHGEMRIALLSLINVVHEKADSALDLGTLHRYMAEMCWYPTAALNPAFSWNVVDAFSARAVLTVGEKRVEGLFKFTEAGDISSFEALRFYGTGADAVRYPWRVSVEAYRVFDGLRIPSRCRVTWMLPGGAFHWLTMEICDIAYHRLEH